MAKVRGDRVAFGQPGIEPRWTHGDKEGIGTAYAASSRVWFTLWSGILTEAYYPTADKPQMRDLQYLVTDGHSFFHEEKRDLASKIESMAPSLGYRISNADPHGRYRIDKEVISDPHQPCILQRTRLFGDPSFLAGLKIYALCAPHLEDGGWKNNASVLVAGGRSILAAEKNGVWLAMAATVPFSRLSCGYVGSSDGWTDLKEDFRMDWEFDQAPEGNVSLMGELDLAERTEFTLGLSFGDGLHNALTTLFEALSLPFDKQSARFTEQWERTARTRLPLESVSEDGGNLYHVSCSLLMAHEDKTFPGALIASLSIPWGEANGDEDAGGYHLVWPRDMVNSALGLLAAGKVETPLRALIYLAASQREDGGFSQNFQVNGAPYWNGIQLDEVVFPILLARRLHREGGLQEFDPYPMVRRAAGYVVRYGPSTQQERWEEAAGYSPSTLAVTIAALICAAAFERERGDPATARFLEEYADFLEGGVDQWAVTNDGALLDGVPRHYVRITPARAGDPLPENGPEAALLGLANQPPGAQQSFPARDVVDAGFLELVRYGIRKPDDPLMVDSLRVIDAVLKVDTPFGPCWRRYNHDGYGQRSDGGPYVGWGVGRAWPLLTGERAHYEQAAGRSIAPFIQAMEKLASPTGLLPEQVWDEPSRPDQFLFFGRPTGSAMPLMWAHSEYIKLLRSVRDGGVFDRIPDVAARYLGDRKEVRRIVVWSAKHPALAAMRGGTLRIHATAPFRLHWTSDDWQTPTDTPSSSTVLGIEFADIDLPEDQQAPIRFTFYWTDEERWEGRDYSVEAR